jgi:hypothetical protein
VTTSDVSTRDAVTMMIGRSFVDGCARKNLQTSSPDIPGITKSSRITSG